MHQKINKLKRIMIILIAIQLVILAVVALNKEKILGTDKKTEAQ